MVNQKKNVVDRYVFWRCFYVYVDINLYYLSWPAQARNAELLRFITFISEADYKNDRQPGSGGGESGAAASNAK